VYLHGAPICVVIFSCWVNMQTLNVLSKQYVNFNMDIINKVITWDVDVIIRFFTQLKIVNFLCLLFCNIILQFCLSLVFNFLQVCATNHSIHKVNPIQLTSITNRNNIFYFSGCLHEFYYSYFNGIDHSYTFEYSNHIVIIIVAIVYCAENMLVKYTYNSEINLLRI